jgi:hypothetical protein
MEPDSPNATFGVRGSIGETHMRAVLYSFFALAALGLAGTTTLSAAPSGGTAIGNAANAGLLTEEVDCRRYPHRHRNAKPHGLGFGCPKRKPAKPKAKKSK